MPALRIAVIGAGQFGRKHIAAIRGEPLAELAAVADPALKEEFAVPCFAGVREMLDKAKPEAVIIATPNQHHVSVGLACVERRVPMLVEKPIADTVADSLRLVEAADKAGVPLLVGHHRRHNPLVEKAREMVHGGALGRLAAVSALWLLQKPQEYFDVAWRREPGGGPLLINTIHDIDDLRYICGEIEAVQAMTSSSMRNYAVEDTAVLALRFASGALGTVTVSDAVAAPWSWELASGESAQYPPPRHEPCYFFSGTGGSLALPEMDFWSYQGKAGWYAPLAKERIAVQGEDPQVRQLRHFIRVARGQEAPLVTGADAARTLATVLALHEAARSGAAIELRHA